MERYDVIVIGAGVVGAAIARELSLYELRVCVLEQEEDVCSGTSKANSGIIHAGYDAVPGTKKAYYNVRGAQRLPELSRRLDFEFEQRGSLLVCFDPQRLDELEALQTRGLENGVSGLRILSPEELYALEPNIAPGAVGALFAPTAGIVCPFGMTIAFAENAADNGAQFFFEQSVRTVERSPEGYRVTTHRGETFCAPCVVNAAGVFADTIHQQVSAVPMHITPRRGEYLLLDKQAGGHVSHTVFCLPGAMGKGVLVTPTVHGNLLVGPTAQDVDDKTDTATTSSAMAEVRQKAGQSVQELAFSLTITSFAGLRAHEDGGDFIIGQAPDAPGFFEAAGIESPGLTSAPAIGEALAQQIAAYLGAVPKAAPVTTRTEPVRLSRLAPEQQEAFVRSHPDYAKIVCRCEQVSEGEIKAAIHRTLGAVSLDGLKRRVRPGMGRCQGGFCLPRTMEILAQERGIPLHEVCKNRAGSQPVLRRAEKGED